MLNKLVHKVGDIEKCAITVANLNSPAVNSRCGQLLVEAVWSNSALGSVQVTTLAKPAVCPRCWFYGQGHTEIMIKAIDDVIQNCLQRSEKLNLTLYI